MLSDREIAEARERERNRWRAVDPRRRHNAGDAEAYGADAILKDGHSIRISMTDAKPLPLQQMSAVPPRQSSEPLVITTGLTGEHRLSRFFYRDGTAKPSRQVRDRERERQQKDDAAVKAVVAFDAQYGGPHRPGYRFADTADPAGTALKEAAYKEMTDHVTHAWMQPEQRAVYDAERAAAMANAAPPAGVDEREWARAQMIESAVWKKPGADANVYASTVARCEKIAQDNSFWQREIPPKNAHDDAALAREQSTREVSDAWRGKQDAAAVATMPAGAYAPVGHGANAGDTMPPRTMSLADGERLKQEAWLEMVNDVSSAWKRQA